jgi:hypothetical protein
MIEARACGKLLHLSCAGIHAMRVATQEPGTDISGYLAPSNPLPAGTADAVIHLAVI